MAKSIVPKGCTVHRIELDGRGGADVGYRCGDEGGDKMFPTPGGGRGTYRSVRLKGIREVSHRGIHISGDARMGFVVSPAAATCTRSGTLLTCKLKGDTSGPSLLGGRRKRRKR